MNSLNEAVTMLASAARTASANGDTVRLLDGPKSAGQPVSAISFTLDVTVDEQTAADKLDVYIQTKPDGTNWLDVVHFTQHDGDAAAKRYTAKIFADVAEAEFEVGSDLAEDAVRNLFGVEWRVRVVIVNDSTNASFTFSVSATPI